MPTAPVHQGCSAIQAITSTPSACSWRAVLVVGQAVGVAAAAHVDPHAGVAVAGQVGIQQLVAGGGAVALAVGQVLEHGRHRVAARRPRAARSWRPGGCRRRAGSRCSRSRAPGRGQSRTTVAIHVLLEVEHERAQLQAARRPSCPIRARGGSRTARRAGAQPPCRRSSAASAAACRRAGRARCRPATSAAPTPRPCAAGVTASIRKPASSAPVELGVAAAAVADVGDPAQQRRRHRRAATSTSAPRARAATSRSSAVYSGDGGRAGQRAVGGDRSSASAACWPGSIACTRIGAR